MDKLKEARKAAQDYVAKNLAACCQEELEWSDTSILCDGKLREAAKMFSVLDKAYALPLAQAETSRQAMRIVADRRAAPAQGDGKPVAINAQFDTGLNRRKLTDLAQRGHEITGHILHKDGKYALFDGSCRWLTQPQYQRLMHEQNDSLFAPAQQAVDLSDEQAWQVLSDIQGVDVIDPRGKTAITIQNKREAGECARALLAAQKLSVSPP